MDDLSLYFFNNQYYDKVVIDSINELKNGLYCRSLETQKNVTNMANYKVPFNDFIIRGETNNRMKLPYGAYSCIIDKNIIPYYNKKLFLSKYGYEKPISMKQIYLDYKVFNQRIICNINSKFITDIYFVALPSDKTLIYFSKWSAGDINLLKDHTMNFSFEYSSDYYYTKKIKSDLIKNNRIRVDTFTTKVELPKNGKLDSYKVYIGNTETNLRGVNGKGVMVGGVLYIELPDIFVEELPTVSLHCFIMNEDRKTGSIKFSKREDNELIFQIDFKKNIIPLENIKIYEVDSSQRILNLLHPTVATIKYPNVYDFRQMGLVNEKMYMIEWYESSDIYTSVVFDNNIKDYLAFKGDSYSGSAINGTLPQPLIDYKPLESYEYDYDDYKNHEYFGDIRKYRISKLDELLKNNSNRSNSLMDPIDTRNRRYIHLSTNGNIDPAIMSRSILDNSSHADVSEVIKFNEPHTYITFSNSSNGNRVTQLYLDGLRTIPTHVYTINHISYVYIPKSKIYKNTEIVIDMAMSLSSLSDNKKISNIIFGSINKPTQFPIKSSFGKVCSHDLIFFDSLTNSYLPKEMIRYGMYADKYTINFEDKETDIVFGFDDRSYLLTSLEELFKTKDLEKVLLNKETIFIESPEEGFYKMIDSKSLTVTLDNISFANTEISITNTDNYRWAKLQNAKIGDIIKLSSFREDTDPRRIKVFYGGAILDESNYIYTAPLKYDGDALVEIISLPPSLNRDIIVEYLPYIEHNVFKGNVSDVYLGNSLIDLSQYSDRELNLVNTKFYIDGLRIASTRIRKYNANNVFMILGLGDNMDLRVDTVSNDPSPYIYKKENFLINNLLEDNDGFVDFMSNKNIVSSHISDDSLNKIKIINGKYFITGYNGTILISNDSIKWFECVTRTSSRINDIVYAKGKYIAVGDNGTILSSDTGEVWDSNSLDIDNELVGISFDNDIFLIVGKSEVMLKSVDGVTWSPVSLPTGSEGISLIDIISTNGWFILYGDSNKIFITADGITWDTLDTNNKVASLARNCNDVLIYSEEYGKISKIVDSVEFSLIPNVFTDRIKSINYSNGLIIVSMDNKLIIIMEDVSLNSKTTNTNYYIINIKSYRPKSALLINDNIVIVDMDGYIHYIPFYHNIRR